MTVFVELDADPPRLRRSDGLIVRLPLNRYGVYPVFEAGWMTSDHEFDLFFRWRGSHYQELQPGSTKNTGGREVLLIGHASNAGYSSAVVSLDRFGFSMEFADVTPPDAAGVDRIVVENDSDHRYRLKRLMGERTTIRLLERRKNADGLDWERFELCRPHEKSAIQHTHSIVVQGRV